MKTIMFSVYVDECVTLGPEVIHVAPYITLAKWVFLFILRYFGHIDVSVTSAAFVVAMALLLQRGIPRFAQLSSAMFGLFYCGYLPCFWVKLRCGMAAPALNTSKESKPYTYFGNMQYALQHSGRYAMQNSVYKHTHT